eukprot:8458130-Pyramimonas_sp.AAC.1
MGRRSEIFLRLFDWAMQSNFEDIPEATLTSSKWIQAVLQKIDLMIRREGDKLRRSGRKALFEAIKDSN